MFRQMLLRTLRRGCAAAVTTAAVASSFTFCSTSDEKATPRRGAEATPATIHQHIDHTQLSPAASEADIRKLCREAHHYRFAAVCVNPMWVQVAKDELEALGSSVHIASVVGFPLGANMPIIKAIEADFAIEAGANEIDMVLPIGKLKENTREAAEYVTRDIAGVVEVCRDRGALCKVIIETCLLTKEEIEKAVMLCAAAGADYVKTSTGFSTGGATVENVKLMATLCDEKYPPMLVKAAGGIRSADDAVAMVKAGASRLGTSRGPSLVPGTAAGNDADSNGGRSVLACNEVY